MVRSFGLPEPEPDDDVEDLEPLPRESPAAGRVTIEVDLAVSDESLEALEAQLTTVVARAVIAGFAAAALQQQN
jgi:hypothetical protein